MNRQDWLLLVVAAAGPQGLTPVQLQKTLFVLGKQLNIGSGFYQFYPYNYGPFDPNVYGDASGLAGLGLVEIRTDGRRWPEYFITSAGFQKEEKLRQAMDPDVVAHISRVVNWTQGLSFPALVRAIYNAYPEYQANSIFRE